MLVVCLWCRYVLVLKTVHVVEPAHIVLYLYRILIESFRAPDTSDCSSQSYLPTYSPLYHLTPIANSTSHNRSNCFLNSLTAPTGKQTKNPVHVIRVLASNCTKRFQQHALCHQHHCSLRDLSESIAGSKVFVPQHYYNSIHNVARQRAFKSALGRLAKWFLIIII